jgi:hypothetical protein
MLIDLMRIGSRATCGRNVMLHVVLVLSLMVIQKICMAQALTTVSDRTPIPTPTPTPTPTQSQNDSAQTQAPLTEREREMLETIKNLQERVSRLEAAQTAPSPVPLEAKPDPSTSEDPHVWLEPVVKEKPESEAGNRESYGRYTPNLGYKIANTEYGDLSLSIYTYARYLNQLGLKSTYTDGFGITRDVKRRQDFQLQKVQIKLLGWILDPKLRYFIYTWTSNPTQGQGAQVVVAGNLNYTFNKYVTLSAGITSLPGVRTTEGNFPFWLGVDSRMIADEFFRPSYTSGVWLKGDITKTLRYQAMLGNNLGTLGVSATRLDNKFNTFSSALVWTPTGEYGQGFGDFEHHEKLATRLGAHFTRSDETKESQPDSDVFENTQIRLSDGTVIFTPDIFGPGIRVDEVRYRMASFDGGLKYRGYSLEGEYYLRWLDNFRGANTAGLPRLFDHGFQLQASAMVIPKTLQAYVGHSRINGEFGKPWDFRAGVNWFPWKNKVVRWNTEWLYLHNSPVGYTSVPFAVGGRGSVFHSSLELAF